MLKKIDNCLKAALKQTPYCNKKEENLPTSKKAKPSHHLGINRLWKIHTTASNALLILWII